MAVPWYKWNDPMTLGSDKMKKLYMKPCSNMHLKSTFYWFCIFLWSLTDQIDWKRNLGILHFYIFPIVRICIAIIFFQQIILFALNNVCWLLCMAVDASMNFVQINQRHIPILRPHCLRSSFKCKLYPSQYAFVLLIQIGNYMDYREKQTEIRRFQNPRWL